MEKAKVLDKNGNVVAEVALPEAVFAYPAKAHLVYEAAVSYLANQRRGSAATKTRAEVSGSNRKPWRQKGTGRARAGATRSPLWRHGGTTFGPQPRDYASSLPRNAKRNALRSALAGKYAEKRLLILDDMSLKTAKTKDAAALLKGLNVDSALVVDGGENTSLFQSLKNIPKVKGTDWKQVNTHDVLKHRWLVIGRQAFVSLMEKLT
jgi:large subunit ribosomal protein L4